MATNNCTVVVAAAVSMKRKRDEDKLVANASKMDKIKLLYAIKDKLHEKIQHHCEHAISLNKKFRRSPELRYRCLVNLNYRKILVLRKKAEFVKVVELCHVPAAKK